MPASERLLLRLKPTSSEYKAVYKQFDSRRAGYNGECNVDRQLSKLSPIENFTVLQDITIQINPQWTIQVDTLIITDKYLLILEIKSYRGILHFEEDPHALIQVTEEETFVRRCPQLQAMGYVDGLKEWLRERGFNVPFYVNLVLGFPTAQVKTSPKLIRLLQAEQVPNRIRELNRTTPTVLNKEEVLRLVSLLKAANNPLFVFPLATYYRIDPSLIKKGIICDECGSLLRKRNHIYWECPSCLVISNEAPHKAISDWLWIMKPTITNEECRSWLGLKDKYAASYLLRHSTLEKLGNNRSSRYRFSNS